MSKKLQRPFPLGIHLDVTNRLWRAAMDKSICFTYINRPHWLTLSSISDLGDGCNLKMIVHHLNGEVSTISRALRFLEENQLITKMVDCNDRRKKGIKITPAGRKILTKLDTAIEPVRKELLADVTKEQFDVFCQVLLSIKKRAIKQVYGNVIPDELY